MSLNEIELIAKILNKYL